MNSREDYAGSPIELSRTSDGIHIPPVFSSTSTSWNNIFIEKYSLSKNISTETESCYSNHTIIIHSRGEARVRCRVKSSNRNDLFVSGDIGIFPKNFPFFAQVEEDTCFLALHLDPSILSRTAYESFGSD